MEKALHIKITHEANSKKYENPIHAKVVPKVPFKT